MESKSSGLGCGTVLFLIFLTLKLLGLITWSWWWVTAPLWIGFALFGVFAMLAVFIAVVLRD